MKLIITIFFALFFTSNQIDARQIWKLFDSTNSIMEVNRVNNVIVDKDDNVWFTTGGYGSLNEYKANVYKYKNGQFTVYNPYKSIKGREGIINDLLIDPFSSLWIASQRIGVAQIENNRWKQHLFDSINTYTKNNLDFVKEIEIDNENNIWVGSFDGLYKIDLNMNLISPIYRVPLKRNRVLTVWEMIYDNKNNELWFSAVNEALFKKTGDDITRFDYDSIPNLAGTNLNNLILDNLGNIWFSADNGVEKYSLGIFNGNSFVTFDSNDTDYAKSKLLPLGVDYFGTVWFSLIKFTDKLYRFFAGLVKYDGKTWELFDTTNTDLPTNTFYSISFDSFNNIWLGTDKGLLVLNLGEDGVVLDVDENNLINPISITPNPATDFIEVTLGNFMLNEVFTQYSAAHHPVLNVKVYNVLGVCLITSPPTPLHSGEGSKVRIDISTLAPGMYFVKIGEKVSKFVKI